MTHAYPKTLKEAAELLDKTNPGWHTKINVTKLSMTSNYNCILGQLYGTWEKGLQRLFDVTFQSTDDIFGSWANVESWKNEISLRLKPTVSFGEAMQAAIYDGRKIVCKGVNASLYVYFVSGQLKWSDGQPLRLNMGPNYKDGWTILPKEVTLADLAAGQKFKTPNNKALENVVYTKPENLEHKAIYEGHKIATITSDTIVEIVG